MDIIIPFASRDPKTRLSGRLSLSERREFARTMLDDVLAAVSTTDHDPLVLAKAPLDIDIPISVDSRPLSDAVNDIFGQQSLPFTILMADLPLIRPTEIRVLVEQKGDIVVAPGLGGGTNALVVRHPEFRVNYHDVSYRKHVRYARNIGARVDEVDSFRLALDVDKPCDLIEVLLHSNGHAHDWLVNHGYTVSNVHYRNYP